MSTMRERADEQHFVTLYLIFWSYVVNLTYIGVAIFVSMDFSDVWLAVYPFRFSLWLGMGEMQ